MVDVATMTIVKLRASSVISNLPEGQIFQPFSKKALNYPQIIE